MRCSIASFVTLAVTVVLVSAVGNAPVAAAQSSGIATVPILKWGATGHSIVAAIAQSLLTAAANSTAETLLPDYSGSLPAIASWADSVRHSSEYSWSAPLHFINTPDWVCDYDHDRDCVGKDGQANWCADGAIQNYTTILSTSPSSADRTEALKFLVHFVGDIHQPLHVGFTTDEGGNSFRGTYEGASTNLHAIWDEKIIETRVNSDYEGDNSAYTQDLIGRVAAGGEYAKEVAKWRKCSEETDFSACSVDWAGESINDACDYSYVQVDGTHIASGFDLKDPYYKRNMPIIEIQLAKAGVRLANVLNQICNNEQHNNNNNINILTS